eukprot:1638602-Lingulodinium_polyedra.AAC.1
MAAPTVPELALQYCKVHAVLEKKDTRIVEKLCEVLQEVLRGKAQALVSCSAGNPILCSFSSDGTPAKTVQRFTACLDPNHKVVRS